MDRVAGSIVLLRGKVVLIFHLVLESCNLLGLFVPHTFQLVNLLLEVSDLLRLLQGGNLSKTIHQIYKLLLWKIFTYFAILG